MNLIQFAKRMNSLADQLPNMANDICKKYVPELALELAYATPVDTSQALSNWQVSVGSKIESFIPAHSLGFNGSTTTASVNQTYALAKIAADKGLPGQAYWLSNNTPYIIDLNNGSSKQAPVMFIQKTISLSLSKIGPIAKQVLNDYRKR